MDPPTLRPVRIDLNFQPTLEILDLHYIFDGLSLVVHSLLTSSCHLDEYENVSKGDIQI